MGRFWLRVGILAKNPLLKNIKVYVQVCVHDKIEPSILYKLTSQYNHNVIIFKRWIHFQSQFHFKLEGRKI